jgi:hypothetical protein
VAVAKGLELTLPSGPEPPGAAHRLLIGLRSGPPQGGWRIRGESSPPVLTFLLRISVVAGPLSRPPPAEGSFTEPGHGLSLSQDPAAAAPLAVLTFCIRTPRPAAGALGAGAMRKLRQVQPIPALWSFMAMAISSGVMPAGKAISGPARSKSAAEVAPAGYALQAP